MKFGKRGARKAPPEDPEPLGAAPSAEPETEDPTGSPEAPPAERPIRPRVWESRRFRTGLLFAAAVILIYVAISNFGSLGGRIASFLGLFSPLFVGVLLALILNTPLRGIERFFFFLKRRMKGRHKPSDRLLSMISLAITYVLAGLLLFFIGNSLIPQVADSFQNLLNSLNTYYPRILSFLRENGIDTAELEAAIGRIDLNEIWRALTANAGMIWNTALTTVNGILSVLTTALTAVIFSAYILANRANLARQGRRVLAAYCKPETASRLVKIGRLTVQTFSNFFSGQCVEAIILGAICFFFLTVFGFSYAAVISLIIMITAFIPYFGAFISTVIGALLIWMQSPMRALLFILMYQAIQQLENHLIYPRVVGSQVGLPPIWTFAALITGGLLFGVTGMILFIPLVSVIYSLVRDDVALRLRRKQAAGEPIDLASDRPDGPPGGA